MECKQQEAIRQAIVCREYEKARRLWAEYVGALRGEFERGALTRAQMEGARKLFEWARVTMLCRRAHIRQRLRGLQAAGAYCRPAELPRQGASFSGKL
jgi:hypothetical protein